MKGIDSGLQVNLTLHLAMVAFVTSAVLWRLSNTSEPLTQLRFLIIFRQRAFLPPRLSHQLTMIVGQITIRFCEIAILVYIVCLTFSYRETLETLLGADSSYLDMMIINSLLQKARIVNYNVKVWCAWMAGLMLMEFISSILSDGLFDKIERSNIPPYTHRYLRPRNWRNCFEGMWYDRVEKVRSKLAPAIKVKNSSLLTQQVTWKKDWTEWTRYVTVYDSWVHQKIIEKA